MELTGGVSIGFYFFSAPATNKAAATTASATSAYITTLLSDEASAFERVNARNAEKDGKN